jgi:hypothetical protein
MKPYHLMTAAEKLAARIASNRELDTKIQPVLRAQETAAAQSYSRGVKKQAIEEMATAKGFHVSGDGKYILVRKKNA